jgi:hypothetical protein
MLRVLGRLSHAWQDFYGHAMLADPGGLPPFEVWSGGPPNNVSPDDVLGLPPMVVPPSYPGDHPVDREPDFSGPELERRRALAEAYTIGKLAAFLDTWANKCGSICLCLDCRCALADLDYWYFVEVDGQRTVARRRLRGPAMLFRQLPNYCPLSDEVIPFGPALGQE